ncbi:conserved hypothetical protein [Ricinus communis]|uniref:Uncharacterized protein n=1 Tax=Ricinus communis TaxID=3988 RepID=B9TG10_RICCO|nr:conserved hypothetical protein [Ricinus communis]
MKRASTTAAEYCAGTQPAVSQAATFVCGLSGRCVASNVGARFASNRFRVRISRSAAQT